MGMTMMFLTIYYTDVFKLAPAAMGTLFLLTRFIDAISDPLIGSMSDRTQSKLGRYRPWLLWFAIPYGLSCAAVFFSPDLSGTARTLYAYITYIALVLSFSLVVVPYVSLLGAISADSDERIAINTIRFPLAKVSYLICSLVVPTLIALFHNEVLGYRFVMAGIGLFCTVLVLLCYANTHERILPGQQEDLTLANQIKLVFKNDQAMIIFGAQIVIHRRNCRPVYHGYSVKKRHNKTYPLVSEQPNRRRGNHRDYCVHACVANVVPRRTLCSGHPLR